jgi:hypothetical protein
MNISSELSWLEEYVQIAKKKIKKKFKISRIKSRYTSKVKYRPYTAKIETENDYLYLVSIYMDYEEPLNNASKRVIKPYSKIDILRSLAHELAHICHWRHTPEHNELECRLLISFMRRLKKNGYVSEESEFKLRTGSNYRKCST